MGHKRLVELANEKLKTKGFTDEQIFREYHVKTEKSWMTIDIVGISDERKVAFEVGQIGSDRLKKLEQYFDEVYHIPYGIVSEDGRAICFVCGYKWKVRVAFPKECPGCKVRLCLNESSGTTVSALEVN